MNSRKDYSIKGNGIPVVMLHSSMSNRGQWNKLSAQLVENYRVLAIDLYGYGEAEHPDSPESFCLWDEMKRVQEIILKTINDQPFHLVGHSYGGATALRLVYENSLQVKSLSVFEPVAFHLLEKTDPAFIEIIDIVNAIDLALKKSDFASATRIFVDFWSGEGTFDKLGQERQSYLSRYIKKVALDFQALVNEPLTLEHYRSITLPVCMITSPQSPLPSRQIVDNLRNTLPDTVLHYTAGGHMAPIGNAREVNPVLEGFIRSF